MRLSEYLLYPLELLGSWISEKPMTTFVVAFSLAPLVLLAMIIALPGMILRENNL